MAERISLELLLIITYAVPHDDLRSLCNAFDISYDEVLASRCNPLKHLGSLVKNSARLMEFMRLYSIFLTGLRAAELFYPDVGEDSTSWNFVGHGNPLNTLVFAKSLESEFGVHWEAGDYAHPNRCGCSPLRPETTSCGGDRGHDSGIVSLQGIVNGQKVMLDWSENFSPSNIISRAYTTTHACILTGYGAISPYHSITSQGSYVIFQNPDQRLFLDGLPSGLNRTSFNLPQIYHTGNEVIDFVNKSVHAKGDPLAIRTAGDDGSLILDFEKFVEDTQIARIGHRIHYGELKSVNWIETMDDQNYFSLGTNESVILGGGMQHSSYSTTNANIFKLYQNSQSKYIHMVDGRNNSLCYETIATYHVVEEAEWDVSCEPMIYTSEWLREAISRMTVYNPDIARCTVYEGHLARPVRINRPLTAVSQVGIRFFLLGDMAYNLSR